MVPPGKHLVSPRRERIFDVPLAVLLTAAALGFVHLIIAPLTEAEWREVLYIFAFIPARYDWSVLTVEPWWIGWGAAVWTFVTYAFIHGNLGHLFFNLVWLLAFGTPVARRFGSLRFAIFFVLTAFAGAGVHLAVHFDENLPVIGASAAISGAMAAAMRFVFQRGGPLATLRGGDTATYRVPAVPLSRLLRDPRVLAFLLVWLGLNLLFGKMSTAMPGMGQSIAWEAHIGGFLAGLFGFSAFDPVRPSTETHQHATDESEFISENDKP